MRAIRVVVWGFVILFNAYCYSLHPWGREVAIENQRVFRVSEKFASLLAGCIYSGFIGYLMAMMVLLRFIVDHLFGLYLVNGLGYGVVARFGVVLWKYMGILSDWWHDHLIRFRFFHTVMVGPRELVILPRNARLHEFGAIRSFLFFLDDNSFAVSSNTRL